MTFTSLIDFLQENLNIIIILIFAALPLYIGSAAATRTLNTESDFFLCNRSLSTPSAFFTVDATWWSTFAFLGSTSSFFFNGCIYWIALGWNVLFGLLFMMYGKRLWQMGKDSDYGTIIDFFNDKYHSNTLNILITIILLVTIIPYMMVQLVGGGIVIEIATNSLFPWKLNILFFFIIMVVYLWAGGLRSVVWTDILYAIMIFVGMLSIGIIFISYSGGLSSTLENLNETSPSYMKLPEIISNTYGYGFWISLLFIMPLGEIMMPQIWTRIFAVKEKKTFNVMPFLISVATIAYLGSMLAGNSARVLEPDYSGKTDYLLPTLLNNHATPIITALILSCVVAASLSTINSQLHSLSHIVTKNFYKQYINPSATEKHTISQGKIYIVVISAVTYILLSSTQLSTIFNITLLSFGCVAQLIVPVTGALLLKNHSATASIAGIICGEAVTVIFFFWQPAVYVLHPSIIGLILNLVIYTLIYCNEFNRVPRLHIPEYITGMSTRVKLFWLAILACFALIASPLIPFFSSEMIMLGNIPLVYFFVFALWIILCTLCLIGLIYSWGDRRK